MLLPKSFAEVNQTVLRIKSLEALSEKLDRLFWFGHA